jgi:hypothetical protein
VSSGKERLDRRRFVDEVDPEFVEEDSETLAAALRRVLESLPDGGRALVVGHSPTPSESRSSIEEARRVSCALVNVLCRFVELAEG